MLRVAYMRKGSFTSDVVLRAAWFRVMHPVQYESVDARWCRAIPHGARCRIAPQCIATQCTSPGVNEVNEPYSTKITVSKLRNYAYSVKMVPGRRRKVQKTPKRRHGALKI